LTTATSGPGRLQGQIPGFGFLPLALLKYTTFSIDNCYFWAWAPPGPDSWIWAGTLAQGVGPQLYAAIPSRYLTGKNRYLGDI